jgi:hypothetical protein
LGLLRLTGVCRPLAERGRLLDRAGVFAAERLDLVRLLGVFISIDCLGFGVVVVSPDSFFGFFADLVSGIFVG